ncbi:MAG: hypothetical protein HY721_09275 [Planctomycetes bacterium]|nr:hypothetical protein [Planctomycetota bacterium]
MEIDATVYPDREPPEDLATLEDKADYIHRICSAFDFGVPPEDATWRIFASWKEVFDRFPLAHSPAYHAFRDFYGWEPVPQLSWLGEPGYRKLDAAEEREDGFEGWV